MNYDEDMIILHKARSVEDKLLDNTKYKCAPIPLTQSELELIQSKQVNALTLISNKEHLCTINLESYPQCIEDGGFIPFFCDKEINLTELNLCYSPTTLNGLKSGQHVFSRILTCWGETMEVDFMIRSWDRQFCPIKVSCGTIWPSSL